MGKATGTAAVLLILGILILCGKGDSLIAGFNTASADAREKVDVGRLRFLVGALCLVIAVMLVPVNILVGKSADPEIPLWIFRGVAIILAGLVVVLANTWCKK